MSEREHGDELENERKRERGKQEVRKNRSERCLATSGYKFNQTLHTYPHVAQTVSSQARLSGLPHLAPPSPPPLPSLLYLPTPLVCLPLCAAPGFISLGSL